MVKKIMYLLIVIGLAIAVYYIDYNNKQYKYTEELLQDALEEDNYVDVARIFGGLFDAESLVDYKNDGKDFDFVLYPSMNLTSYDFGDEDKADIQYLYEKCYTAYLYKIDYDLSTYYDENIEVIREFEPGSE